MQLKYGSQNLMLGKYRIRFTDKKYFALDLPIKIINALETTMTRILPIREITQPWNSIYSI